MSGGNRRAAPRPPMFPSASAAFHRALASRLARAPAISSATSAGTAGAGRARWEAWPRCRRRVGGGAVVGDRRWAGRRRRRRASPVGGTARSPSARAASSAGPAATVTGGADGSDATSVGLGEVADQALRLQDLPRDQPADGEGHEERDGAEAQGDQRPVRDGAEDGASGGVSGRTGARAGRRGGAGARRRIVG